MKLTMVLLALLMINTNSFSQKKVNEATMTYKISTESGSDNAMAKALQGATLTVYIKGNQSRTDMVSSLGTESNFYDAKAGKGTILKQYSGQKLMITLNSANWAEKNQLNQNMNFTIENAEQTIAGLSCKKAVGRSATGKPLTVYFAPDIVLSNKQYDNAFAKLPGLPVQFELESGNLKFRYTLEKISYDPVPPSKLDVPKTGFRVMTYEETQQLKKGDK